VVDFTTFLQNVVGIDPLNLPPTAPVIGYAFNIALSIVNPALAAMSGNYFASGVPYNLGVTTPNVLYALAVYNLGADRVINYAPDQTVGGVTRTYFKEIREALGISVFVPGVIASSGNSPTSQSTLNPEFMKTMTLGDLQNLKTPWGREYLNYAMQYGTLWGLS